MATTLHRLARIAFVAGLILALASGAAFAQKSGGAKSGGGGTGGGGGGGGGSSPVLKSVTVPLQGAYYGVGGSGSTVPSGTATLSFDATQATRILTIQVLNLNLPDGMILQGVMLSDGLVDLSGYYPVWQPQPAGSMVVVAGKASITLSTAHGDPVPLFGTTGTITLSAWTPLGVEVGFVAAGSYPANGGKKGGRP